MSPTATYDPPEVALAAQADVHELLEEFRLLVEEARSMPLSNSAIVNRDEALELLDEVTERLPEELRQARWLLKEREEFLARARRDAEEIVTAARARAEGMVTRTEVVREAQRVARITVEQAETQGRRVRNQADEYVDAKLAGFEGTLEKALSAVQKGRRRLMAIDPGEPAPFGAESAPVAVAGGALFDQDA